MTNIDSSQFHDQIPPPGFEEFAPTFLNSLGQEVVVRSVQGALLLQEDITSSPERAEHTAEKILEYRETLEQTTPEARAALHALMRTMGSLSPWLHEQLDLWENESITEKLIEKDSNGQYLVSDELFTHTVEWHNFNFVAFQAEMEPDFDVIKSAVKETIEQMVELGELPAVVAGNLDRFERTQILVDDGFNTLIYGINGGMHTRNPENNTYTVALSPNVLWDEDELLEFATHELVHVLEGEDESARVVMVPRSDVKLEDRFADEQRRAAGIGLARLTDNEIMAVALVEAAVQQLTMGIVYGNIELIDPKDPKRLEQSEVYWQNRYLIDTIMNHGLEKIPSDLLYEAAFANNQDNKGPHTAIYRLRIAMSRAHPGIMKMINGMQYFDFLDEDESDAARRLAGRLLHPRRQIR